MSKYLIVTPRTPQPTGNRVTADRLINNLRMQGEIALGIEVDFEESIEPALEDIQPDVVVFLHAVKTGRMYFQTKDNMQWNRSRGGRGAVSVVILTGSDVHGDMISGDRRERFFEVVNSVDLVASQNKLTVIRLNSSPVLKRVVRWIPQGIEPGYRTDCQTWRKTHDGALRVLIPASFRMIKGHRELFLWLEMFQKETDLQMVVGLCGVNLDEKWKKSCMEVAPDFVKDLGYIPPSEMHSAISNSHVVINNSMHEGLSQTLCESTLAGTFFVARRHEGNEGVFDYTAQGGCLFEDYAEFKERMLWMSTNRGTKPCVPPGTFDPKRETTELRWLVFPALHEKLKHSRESEGTQVEQS